MRLKDFGLLKTSGVHFCWLAVILLLGTALRFWHLDAKPLWLDEVLTALFSMGRSYDDVPVQTLMPLAALEHLFRVQSGLSCLQIAQTVATESVHPPLFFCLMYGWMSWLHPGADNWVWALRALPAGMGVGAIAAIYLLNRIAFSPAAGLLAAALMAVSPFAVYLSQEARHYTLPMVLITLALVGLVQIQRDLQQQRLRPPVWIGWTTVNIISLYVHYFCLLALIAQVLALVGWMLWSRLPIARRSLSAWGFALAGISLSYLPWLPMMLNHMSRPETDWLQPQNPTWIDRVAPLYQTLIGWVLMAIALPVEEQEWAIALPASLVMLLFAGWLIGQTQRGFRHHWRQGGDRSSLVLLIGFTVGVLVQFLAIVYILDKDITAVPRYNFVYYPGMCALLGACLSGQPAIPAHQMAEVKSTAPASAQSPPRFLLPITAILLVGVLSSILVVQGVVFQKSYNPDKVVGDMTLEPSQPQIIVTGYRSLQEIALGLSVALKLQTDYPDDASLQFGFLDRRGGVHQVWRTLPRLSQSLPLPLYLWVVMPEIRKHDYPPRLWLMAPSLPRARPVCRLDLEEFHRLGFPYQLYRCK